MKFNQCTSILRASHPPCETTLRCDANGNPVDEIHTFIWDENNIVLEKIALANGTTRMCEYFWGIDKSGSEQGAGGVGGLLAVSVDGVFYIPCYDHNGNIVLYVSEAGNIAARYTYDPYGNITDMSGALATQFSFGFSTKCHDRETGMVDYQRRFYRPDLGRWLNRDPIEERGGENLYAFCANNPIRNIDPLGESVVVIRHLPGTIPDKGWSFPDSSAETHWNYPMYTVSSYTCCPGRIGFKVDINPPVIVVHVYFRTYIDTLRSMSKEQQHINAIIRYDDALSEYKAALENVCETPDEARRIRMRESEKLLDAYYDEEEYHNKLDAPGGPHGH